QDSLHIAENGIEFACRLREAGEKVRRFDGAQDGAFMQTRGIGGARHETYGAFSDWAFASNAHFGVGSRARAQMTGKSQLDGHGRAGNFGELDSDNFADVDSLKVNACSRLKSAD